MRVPRTRRPRRRTVGRPRVGRAGRARARHPPAAARGGRIGAHRPRRHRRGRPWRRDSPRCSSTRALELAGPVPVDAGGPVPPGRLVRALRLRAGTAATTSRTASRTPRCAVRRRAEAVAYSPTMTGELKNPWPDEDADGDLADGRAARPARRGRLRRTAHGRAGLRQRAGGRGAAGRTRASRSPASCPSCPACSASIRSASTTGGTAGAPTCPAAAMPCCRRTGSSTRPRRRCVRSSPSPGSTSAATARCTAAPSRCCSTTCSAGWPTTTRTASRERRTSRSTTARSRRSTSNWSPTSRWIASRGASGGAPAGWSIRPEGNVVADVDSLFLQLLPGQP